MLLFLLLLTLVNGLCWTPDGTLTNDVPCDTESEHSVCCTAGFLCMSNGLCQPDHWWAEQSDKFIRASCNDKSWKAPECRGYCVAENPGGGEWVMRCDKDSWCCAHEDCCSNDSTKHRVGVANVTATAGVRAVRTTSSLESSSTKDAKSRQSTADLGLSTTTSASSDASSTSSSILPASEQSNSPPANANDPDENTSKDSKEGGSSLGMRLGIGIGAAVAVTGIGIGVALWLRRKKKTQKMEVVPTSEPQYVPPPQFPSYPTELHGTYAQHEMPADTKWPIAELGGDPRRASGRGW